MKKLLLLSLAILMILCCFASCDWFLKTPEETTAQPSDHEHSWEYIQYETGHFKQYTCGCPSPEIMELHCNYDADMFCDICGYHLSVNTESCNHQWDEGVEVESGSGGYVMEYTCTLCGSKNREIITIIPPIISFAIRQVMSGWMKLLRMM